MGNTPTAMATAIPLVQIMPSTWTPEPTITQAPTDIRTSTNTITPTVRITIKLITPLKYPTSTPYGFLSCPSDYDKTVHESNLIYLHNMYAIDANYYDEQLQQALLENDAILMFHIDENLARAKQNYKNQVKQENARYAALCK